MGILFLLLGVAVIGGAALLISGRWRDGLPDTAAEEFEAPLAAVPLGDVSAADLEDIRLDQAVRGYRMDEVDALVERLGAEISSRDDEIRRLRGESSADDFGDPTSPDDPTDASVDGAADPVVGTAPEA